MHRRIAYAVGALLVTQLLAAIPAKAATYGVQVQTAVIETEHGPVYAEIALPVDGDQVVPSPVVLTYSPYGALGRTANRQLVPDGYAVVVADVLGTGNSGGCFDYGGAREQQSAHELIAWAAGQDWSTGRVAMVGGSYDGATANAAAVGAPESLETIVSIGAVARWYGLTYGNGLRYSTSPESPTVELLGTPLVLGSGLALPPPLDNQSPDWAGRVQASINPCDAVAHNERGYDETPDYDAFWQERDYVARAADVDIPTFTASNWGDGTVKPSEQWDWFHALVADEDVSDPAAPQRVLWMGSRWDGHEQPAGIADDIKDWLDHYLKDDANGIDGLARYVTQTADSTASFGEPDQTDQLTTTPVELIAQGAPLMHPGDYAWKLRPLGPEVPTPPATGTSRCALPCFPGTGANAESHMNHHPRFNHEWFWFESPPLTGDVRIIGRPVFQIRAQTDREWVTLTPTLVDFDHECHVMVDTAVGTQHVGPYPTCTPRALYSVSRGFLDTRYRDGLATQSPLPPDAPFGVDIAAQPVDYTFGAGHQISIQIASEIIESALPKAYPCTSLECVNIRLLMEQDLFRVVLPVVGPPADPMELFDEESHH